MKRPLWSDATIHNTRNQWILLALMVGFPLASAPAGAFAFTHAPPVSFSSSMPSTTTVHANQNYSTEPSRLSDLVAYQYGTPCATPTNLLLCQVNFPVEPCVLTAAVNGCQANLTISSSDPTSTYAKLAEEGILDPQGVWYNNTEAIDWGGSQQAGAAYGLAMPTFYGSQGLATSIYGGVGPVTDKSSYFNTSQSIVLYYGSPSGNSTTGAPNVATGVTFYAKALDGSSALLKATLSCTSGFGNAVTGEGGSVSSYIPVNPSILSPTSSSSLLTSTPGDVSLHFAHYLWCGDVNDTEKGPFTLTLTILPWTISGQAVGSGTSGIVSFSRIEIGQQSADGLSSASSGLPKGNLPDVVTPSKGFALDTQLSSTMPIVFFNVTAMTDSTMASGYRSNYGFTVNETAMPIGAKSSNPGCPPAWGVFSSSGGCGLGDWNAGLFTYFNVMPASVPVFCLEMMATGSGNQWTVAPDPYHSSMAMNFTSHPTFGNPTCQTSLLPTGVSYPSVINTAYSATGGENNKAFVAPTVLYGYLGTRNPVDGEIALPASVSLTNAQKVVLADESYVNVTWWDSYQDPLIQLLNPTNSSSGTGGQPLYWHVPLHVGITSAYAYNSVHSLQNWALGPLSNQSGGCPGSSYFATGPALPASSTQWTFSPLNWASNPTEVSSSMCVPTLYFNYTPSLPFPIGYDFYQAGTTTTGDTTYAEGQTILADNYIVSLSMPGFGIRESFAVPGLNGVLLPYPYTSFPSLLQSSLSTASWWWNTTQSIENACPMAYTTVELPPSGQYPQISNVPALCSGTGVPVSTGNKFLHPWGYIASMTPAYGGGCAASSTVDCVLKSGTPRSSVIYNSSVPSNATAFTAHLPWEQVSGYPVILGTLSSPVTLNLYAYTYNLSMGSRQLAGPGGSLTAVSVQEFLILASPLYATLNLGSVTATSCSTGGIVNASVSGVQFCSSSHTQTNTSLIPSPSWQPVQPSPLGMHISLVSHTLSPSSGLSNGYVRNGPWMVRTSLSDYGNYASNFNSTCGANISSQFAGPVPNMEPTAYSPTNYSDISDPYWWSNTSLPSSQPECVQGYVDPYWAYSSNVHTGLLPLGNYTFSTHASNYVNGTFNATLASPDLYNDSLLLCYAKFYNNASSGCDLNKYNVYLFSFTVENRSGGTYSLLTGTFVTVSIDGTGQPSMTLSLNSTGCAQGFCNADLLLITPKTSHHNVTFIDHLASTATPPPYLPAGPLNFTFVLNPEKSNTTSYSISYFWSPNYASCALSGTCGCLYNCGSTGFLGWLLTNVTSLLIVLVAALVVAGIAYYLHRKGDDQLAGLEITGGAFVVVGLAWLLLVANGNLSDSIWLALLITGASIMAPGAGILLATRNTKPGSSSTKRST